MCAPPRAAPPPEHQARGTGDGRRDAGGVDGAQPASATSSGRTARDRIDGADLGRTGYRAIKLLRQYVECAARHAEAV